MNKNVPKLRFKEFSDEWDIKPFFECIAIKKGLVNPLESPYNKMIHIGPANIEKYTGRLLEYRTAEEDKVESGKYLFDKQSIIYSKIRPELSKVAYPKFEGICSADTYPLNPINEYMISEFIYYQLLTNRFLKFVTSTSERTKMPKVNREELSLYKFKFPSLQEQERIANFFTVLDNLIEEQEAKVNDLELYKKGMMQQIFKQKIRFKDENGQDYPAWEEKKLGDISKIIMGQSPSSTAYNENNEGLPLVQGNADINNRVTAPRIYTNEITKTCELKDIIMSVRAPVGTIAIANQVCCIGRGVCAIKSNSNQNYLYQVLLEKENKWNKISQGSTFESINSNDIKSLKVSVPSLQEQTKIANFLSNIDNLIEEEQKNLNDLKEMKKGLLQQMFV